MAKLKEVIDAYCGKYLPGYVHIMDTISGRIAEKLLYMILFL